MKKAVESQKKVSTQEIKAVKDGVRERIAEVGVSLKELVSKVPDYVVKGGYRTAVEWKRLAHEVLHGDAVSLPKRITLAELEQKERDAKRLRLKLEGSLPMLND